MAPLQHLKGQHTMSLQQLQQLIIKEFEIDDDYIASSNHAYSCRCKECLQWWVETGPEDLGYGWGFGPFTEKEFVDAGGKITDYNNYMETEQEFVASGGEFPDDEDYNNYMADDDDDNF
jgi:hypothetical protein